MDNEEIFNNLKKILIEDFEVEEDQITLEASFADDLGLDSLDAIDLVIILSNTYNINIDNKSIEKAKTIQQLMDAIQEYLNK